MKKKIIPTEKQKKFVQNKLRGMSSRKAAIEAGYSVETADNANRAIAEKYGTKAYSNKLGQLLEDNGVTDNIIAQKIKAGLEATGFYGKDAYEGTDYKTRLEYIKFASELKGHKVNEKIDLNFTNNLFVNVRSGIDKKNDEGKDSQVEE